MALLGPVKCQQCKRLVRWERLPDGSLRLVNHDSGTPHVCQA